MKPVTTFFLLAGASLAVLHYLSLELHLYWRYLWLDIPAHTLGGAVVALGYMSLQDFWPSFPKKFLGFKGVIVFVLLAALSWEVFEISIGIVFDESRYVIDTLTDLATGLIGGTIGFLVGKSVRDLDLYG